MATFNKFSGLDTSHNYVGSVSEGALSVAENAVINAKDTVEPRRGLKSLSYTAAGAIKQLWNYGSSRLVHYGTSIARDTGSAFTAYTGTFTPVDDALCRMRGVEAAQNFYVNAATGLKVLDSGGSFSSAGVPQCLDVFELGMTTSASGFLVPDRTVAYRATVSQQDATGQWREGAPSQRTVVRNKSSYDVAYLQRDPTGSFVTVGVTDGWSYTLAYGNVVTLNTSEANFASGVKTITGVDGGFTYTEAGLFTASTVPHNFSIPNRSVIVTVGIPTGTTSSDVVKLYRTEVTTGGTTDPGDEMYQVGEKSPPAARTVNAGAAAATTTAGKIYVTVTDNSHPFVVGQSIECSGATGFPSGVNIIVATTANTYIYYDPTATSGATSAASLTFTPRTLVFDDNTPDSILGDPLYTNPNTGDGLEASRYEPPVSKDVVRGGGRLWFLNTTQKHRFELQVIGVGSPSGLQLGDTVTLTRSGTAYTYTIANIVSSYSTAAHPGRHIGSPTERKFAYPAPDEVDEAIEAAALNLVRVINQDESSVPFYAVYSSTEDDVAGKITIIEKDQGGAAFTVTASRAGSWSPILPTSGTTVSSDNSADPAGIAWSDQDQPESVPLGNYLRVDAKNDPILRGAWLRDALFVFKQQGGLYVVPNQPPYYARELDPTCRLLAPDTVVACNNQLWALTTQGICAITEAGVDVIGWPVDYDVRALLGQYMAAGQAPLRYPFAVAYESERCIQFHMPCTFGDGLTYSEDYYTYNHATRAFTHTTKNLTCGLVMPGTDILYMGSGDSNTLVRERKSFDETDYADEEYAIEVTGVTGTEVTLASVVNVAVGDVLEDINGAIALVTAIDGAVCTTATASGFDEGAGVVYKGYTVEVATVPKALGDPGSGKQVGRGVATFRDAQVHLGKITVSTDDAPTTQEYAFSTDGYGAGGYGAGGYGDPSAVLNKHATLGTSGSFVTLGFKIRQAWAKWRLLALTAEVTETAVRGR